MVVALAAGFKILAGLRTMGPILLVLLVPLHVKSFTGRPEGLHKGGFC